MFARCIFCHSGLPANEIVERFPHGRRIAFDPGRGRLWVVCDVCRRWNLAPIEERWEALDELEKVVTDRGRLLSETENIALIRAGDIDVVRVGRATRLVEEAWWRYGKELRERLSRHKKYNMIEIGAVVALSAATGGAFWIFGGDSLAQFMRWRRFGSVAWRGSVRCPGCGAPTTEFKFSEARRLFVAPDAGEGITLELKCRRCRGDAGRPRLDGVAAQHVLRRLLAWQHYKGASENRVREATRVIENAGSAGRLARTVASRTLRLDELGKKQNRTESIALEIALNDDAERRLLELELEELEERWREEEELAAIVDGELTPVPALERIRRLINPDARPPRPGADPGNVA